jgi:hypothetical protein
MSRHDKEQDMESTEDQREERSPFAAQFVEVADPAKGPTPREWQTISRELRRPLDPDVLDIMLDFHSNPHRDANGATVQAALVYVSRAGVMDRLDDVVGPGAWAGDFEALILDREIRLAKGWITVYGQAPKADVGSESKQSNSMGAVSHQWRRAADCWGVGRYLRYVPRVEVELVELYKKDGKSVYGIAPAAEKALRERLAAWDGRPGTFPPARPAAQRQQPSGQQTQQQAVQRPAAVAAAARPAPATITASASERQAEVHAQAARPAGVAPDDPPDDITFEAEDHSAEVAAEREAAHAAGDAGEGEPGEPVSMVGKPGHISQQQLVSIRKLWQATRPSEAEPADIERWTNDRARKAITRLSDDYQKQRRAGADARQPVAVGSR